MRSEASPDERQSRAARRPLSPRATTVGHASGGVLFAGFVGGTGGASSALRELARSLCERGVPTRVVVPAWDTTIGFAKSVAELGVPIDRCRWLNLDRGWHRNIVDAVRFLRRYRASVVHFHLSDDYLEPAYLRALGLLRARGLFATMQGPYEKPPDDPRAMELWAELAPRHFRQVVCVSEGSRDRQRRYGLPDALTTVIHNGVNLARYAAGDAATARRALPNVPADAPVVLCLARIEEQKQPLTAIAAFGALLEHVPDAHLVMVGTGPLEEAAAAAVDAAGLRHRVHMMGHQFNVADWLAAATVWFLPTLGEGFSLALLEAMAAGCTVVSTRCLGNDEILVDGENALTVPVGDMAAMIGALRRAIGDPALRARLADGARRSAAEHSIERVTDRHLALYGAAVATHARTEDGRSVG